MPRPHIVGMRGQWSYQLPRQTTTNVHSPPRSSAPDFFRQVYFDDGESVDLGDDTEDLRRQLDGIESGGFEKYQAYLDGAQLNLEVRIELL